MSDINPDFSFPATPSLLMSSFPPSNPRPLSYSPQSRPRKHAHRRSAALSEDLTAMDVASLRTPQMSTAASFSKMESSMSATSTPTVTSQSLPRPSGWSERDSPTREPFDLHSHVQFSNSPLPKRPYQIGEPGQLIAKHRSASPPSSSSSSPMPAPRIRASDMTDSSMTPALASPVSAVSASLVDPLPQGIPPVVLNDHKHESHEKHERQYKNEKHEKRKKRRSFVALFKRNSSSSTSCDELADDHAKSSSQTAPTSPRQQPASPRRSSGLQPSHFVNSPPQSPAGDDTLVASVQCQQNSLRTPVTLQSVKFSNSPITPRGSFDINRESEPLPPTIDLDEALSCSFSHRQPDSVLESPFSKASSIMGAVPEEEEEDGEDDESSETDSMPRQRSQHRASYLQKTDSVCSNSSSIRLAHHYPSLGPRSGSVAVSEYSAASHGGNTISYVGPILNTSSPTISPARSPRVSFEQVSNLAISEPNTHDTTGVRRFAVTSGMTHPTTAAPVPGAGNSLHTETPNRKGHQRRRSLIDKLMRR